MKKISRVPPSPSAPRVAALRKNLIRKALLTHSSPSAALLSSISPTDPDLLEALKGPIAAEVASLASARRSPPHTPTPTAERASPDAYSPNPDVAASLGLQPSLPPIAGGNPSSRPALPRSAAGPRVLSSPTPIHDRAQRALSLARAYRESSLLPSQLGGPDSFANLSTYLLPGELESRTRPPTPY